MSTSKHPKKLTKKAAFKPNYLEPNYHQMEMICIDPEDQIQQGTFEYALRYLIDNKLDLSRFDARFSNTLGGRKAYPPAVLLKIILYSYSIGIISSRKMEQLCKVNVTCMAVSGFVKPDHSTIAAFVSSLEEEIVSMFQQVLLVCNEQGLIGGKTFAIDGCKLPSNASKESSGTHKELKKKSKKIRNAVKYMVKQHKKQDSESKKIDDDDANQKTIDKLTKEADRIDAFLQDSEPRMGSRGKEVKSNITDNDSAKMQTSHGAIQGYNGIATADQKHQIITQAKAHGQGSEQNVLIESLERLQENLKVATPKGHKPHDLKEAKLLADSGYHSESNLEQLSKLEIDSYIADNQFRKRDPRFKDADRYKTTKHGKKPKKNNHYTNKDFVYDATAKTCYCPTGKKMWCNSDKPLKIHNHLSMKFTGREKDCRNCQARKRCLRNEDQISPRQVTIPIERLQPKTNHTARMIKKIDSEAGRKIYSKRLGIIEPIFGNIRTLKRLSHFTLRGKEKVSAQWQLFCMVHNIEKIAHYGTLG